MPGMLCTETSQEVRRFSEVVISACWLCKLWRLYCIIWLVVNIQDVMRAGLCKQCAADELQEAHAA